MFDLANKDSFLNVNKWLDEISVNTSSNIVLILVGNKADKKEELGY